MTETFVAGETLQDYLRRTGRLTPGEAVPLFTQLLRVLSRVHAQGVTHRDIKPGNILVDGSGDSPVVTIADFGLAVQAGTANARVDQAVGTPPYMAPEAIAGGAVGPSADMFAAGVVLYEMLAGRPPFTGRASTAVIDQTLNAEPLPIEGLQDAEGSLWQLLKQLLDKDPAKRPSADQALALLEHIQLARPREVGQGNAQINYFWADRSTDQPRSVRQSRADSIAASLSALSTPEPLTEEEVEHADGTLHRFDLGPDEFVLVDVMESSGSARRGWPTRGCFR